MIPNPHMLRQTHQTVLTNNLHRTYFLIPHHIYLPSSPSLTSFLPSSLYCFLFGGWKRRGYFSQRRSALSRRMHHFLAFGLFLFTCWWLGDFITRARRPFNNWSVRFAASYYLNRPRLGWLVWCWCMEVIIISGGVFG